MAIVTAPHYQSGLDGKKVCTLFPSQRYQDRAELETLSCWQMSTGLEALMQAAGETAQSHSAMYHVNNNTDHGQARHVHWCNGDITILKIANSL